MSDEQAPRVGVLGGTGDLGRGLARRWAAAGVPVVLGSRDAARAQEAADALNSELSPDVPVAGAANADCARAAQVAVVAVPWEGHAALLEECRDALAGKVVVDVVNPLGFDERGAFALPVEQGSACQQAQALLPSSTVVGAFHHVSAVLLLDPEVTALELDVLVLGDDRAATDTVQALAERLPGVRGVYGGRLRNAHQVEALTANLISVNRRYKTHAGVRVTRP
ncbi:NADPH-dependent F420 reductase [Motilibacter peucedani]|uniref:NADPH-dependent F420 reductase n=1 Tax=Motilibacter peucedani TaxID=598650 RepID=UPI001E484274|nr:NADPH-dependent F420 reductase [Motilibacter peucedani]